jgi:sporulation protein YlmC with PRC-barrel domain
MINMLRSINHLRGYSICAKDGDIGEVDDFLFDDQSWAIRYLVVDTGNWLIDRPVLVLPASLDVPDWETETLTVKLTRKQIEDSPPLAMDEPVSRQKEAELHRYYGLPGYWALQTPILYPDAGKEKGTDMAADEQDDSNPHLRSVTEVSGYNIRATDGEIGHVDDFIVEDESWIIRHIIVDTRNWLPGKKVLVSPTWIESVDWNIRRLSVDLKRETIEQSPEFDPSEPVNREYEIRLYDYYGRPRYWVRM